jgi:hypothetical protein
MSTLHVPGTSVRSRVGHFIILPAFLMIVILVACCPATSAAGPPTVSSITPASARSGTAVVKITSISGTGFAKGASVRLSAVGLPDINATNVSLSASKITCRFDLTNARQGARDVVVTNPDGGSASLPGGFTVLGARTFRGATKIWNGFSCIHVGS